MRDRADVRRLIDGLCDGDLNSEARAAWTVEYLRMLGEWAEATKA